ncbi:mechanosensitive ion channel [Candidatus Woesearchaeota archaeon]|nr:mechanosensitive ion channel [Candidatus Woesearchaeota archaeon]
MVFNYAFLEYELWNNSIQNYILAIGVFLLSMGILRIFKAVVLRKLKKIAKKTKTKLDDALLTAVEEIGWTFYLLLGLLIALRFIQFTGITKKIVDALLLIAIAFYIVRFVQKVISRAIKLALKKRRKTEDEEIDQTTAQLLTRLAGLVLWVVAIILIISNLGYDVSTLIAGLGIGGIAIAFALQNVLSDIFASFSIYIDKPFKVGDFIIIGDDLGVVKKIGIKTTRIQHLRGEELTVSNRELTSTRVHNFKRMQKRRIDFKIGVTYDTPVNKLEKIPKIVEKIISGVKGTELDRVHFKSYGDFSLNYEIVYYLDTNDYNIYMDVQQEINLALKRAFEREKIEFAYPTQTIFVEK